MTAPLSLLSLLGADPAPQSQTPVDDPAAFAAALAAAIQLLQPTAPLAPAPVVVTLPTETAEEPTEAAARNETETEPRPAGVFIEVELGQPIASEPTELDGDSEVDPEFQVPVTDDAQAEIAPSAGQPEPSAKHPEVQDEVKQPWLPGQKRPVPQAAPVPAPERAPAPAPEKPSDKAPRVTVSRAAPVIPQTVPQQTVSHQAVSQQPNPAPGTVDNEAPTPLPVVTRAPSGKCEAPKARRAREAAPADTQPAPAESTPRQLDVPLPASPSVPVQAVLQAAPPTIKAEADQPPAPQEGRDRPAATDLTTAQQAEPAPSGEFEPWSQAGNARLASQLAEIMDGLNVSEFKVELARRPTGGQRASQPETVGLAHQAKTPAPSTDVAKPAKADPILAEPLLSGPLVAPKPEAGTAKLKLPAEESSPAVNPAPKSAATDVPVASKPVSAPATPIRTADNDLDTAVELPVALPRRVLQRSAEPTLPVSRQELPQPDRSSRNAALAEPVRQRERHDAPSDSAASVSASAPSPAERVVARSEEGSTRGTREARNLPQPDSGDNRPAGSADRVTLQVSDGDGRQTRIRVSVVGDQVRAVITPPDNESARQLEHRMDELQTALARQGYTATKVSIQAAAESGSEAMAGAGLAVGSSEARTTPGREQPAGDQRQGRNPRDQQQSQGGGQQQRQSHGRNRDQGAEQRRR